MNLLSVSLMVLPPLALLLIRQGKFYVRFDIILRLEKLYPDPRNKWFSNTMIKRSTYQHLLNVREIVEGPRR